MNNMEASFEWAEGSIPTNSPGFKLDFYHSFQIIFGFTFPVVFCIHVPRLKVNKDTYFLRLYIPSDTEFPTQKGSKF